MSRLKSYLQVTAGIIPGEPIPERTKRWEWIPKEIDGQCVEKNAEELLKFHENSEAAHAYARQLENPGFYNWVKVEWVWL